MDATELAYAGIARQAELIAAGEVSSRELVDTYLERIARLDPKLNSFRVVFEERARLEAEQADARRGAGGERPLLGVPIAIKDDMDVAGEVTAFGTNAHGGPAEADAELVRRLREAGAVIVGKTQRARAHAVAVHGERDVRHHAQPLGSPALAGGLERRQRGGGRGGARGCRCGLGRRRLDPHPGGVVRVVRPEAPARPGSDGAEAQPVARPVRVGRPQPPRGRHGAVPRRGLGASADRDSSAAARGLLLDGGANASAGGCGSPTRRACPSGVIARLDADAQRALEAMVELLRSLGHEVTEQDPDYGYDAIQAVLVRYLRGIHDDALGMAHPERLERRTRAMARIGGLIPESVLERALAGEQEFARRLGGVLESHDVLITPATASPPPRVGRLEGRGAIWTLNTVGGWVPYNGVWNVDRPARGGGARGLRLGRPAAGGADRRARQRRDHAAVAGRADRGRAPLGAAAPARVLVSEADSLLEVAVEAARMAGALLAERVRRGVEREVVSKSTPTDLVSEADLAAEHAIRELLAERRPDDAFLGEEGERAGGSSGLCWVVDPLDGTVNFLFGIPQWCVSVAVRDDDGALAGAIYDPNRNELFTATRGGRPRLIGPAGAHELSGRASPTTGAREPASRARPRRVRRMAREDDLATAMVATGLAYDAGVREAQAQVLARLVPRVRDIRRLGSAALDLAWTAAGRYDAYFERIGEALGHRGRPR